MDYKKKFLLFKQSQHFCSAPWGLLYIGPGGEVQTCTRGRALGNVHDADVQDILRSNRFVDIKENILQDQISDNCKSCIKLENHGNGSKNYKFIRNMYNELLQSNEVDYSDTKQFVLGAVDLHWSSICDLKCVTCWAKQSSSLAKEQGLPVSHTSSSRAYQVIDFIEKNQHTLREVYLSGGEPTLIKYNLQLLQRLQKRSNLLIRVNSNLMWDQDNEIVKEIVKFPNVMFTCSADNIADKFEYIRRGATWSKFVENINYLKKFHNVKLRINSVFFVLSALDLADTIMYFNQHHNITDFTINQCFMHDSYRSRNLPDTIKIAAKDKLLNLKSKFDKDLNLVGCINNCLIELDQSKTQSYLTELDLVDAVAATKWRSIFPELV